MTENQGFFHGTETLCLWEKLLFEKNCLQSNHVRHNESDGINILDRRYHQLRTVLLTNDDKSD